MAPAERARRTDDRDAHGLRWQRPQAARRARDAWQPYLQQRAVEVAPIFERSGIASWTEFCVRFAHSFPQVRATVGATSRLENLAEFLGAAKDDPPLPQAIGDEICSLQHRWSDETDIHAEPWTM